MTDLLCPACGRANAEWDPCCGGCGEPLPTRMETLRETPADPLIGRTVSHFQVLGRLGQGGMGTVYRATDLDLDREVALKFPSRAGASPEQEARFLREARAAAALDHPNIGTLYEAGEHQGRRFLALAFYPGETLAQRLDRGVLPMAEVGSLAAQLASALATAHAAGIVHRDLKPANVLLARDGRPRLLDFGIARLLDGPPLTAEGMAVGTAAYMAPEQLRGEECGPEADLWALGVVIYEMLAGRHPFGFEIRGMTHAILHEPPAPLLELRPDTLPVLARVVDRCLAKSPGDRPAAAQILDELRAEGFWDAASGRVSVPGAVSAAVPQRRRGLAGAAVLLAAGVAAGFLLTREPSATIHLAVLPPEVSGRVDEGDRAAIAAGIETALLRTLGALEGVEPLEPTPADARASAPEAARAAGADEVFASRADCSGDLCQVTLRRLAGGDGAVLWADTLRISQLSPRVSAEALASRVRQAYPDRRLRLPTLELRATDEDYARYLDLAQRMIDRREPLEEILAEAEALRRRSPDFIEAYALESKLALQLFLTSRKPEHLEHSLEAARLAAERAPDDPRPPSDRFHALLEGGRLDEAREVLTGLERASGDVPGLLLMRARLAEREGDAPQAVELMQALVRDQPTWRYLLILANMEYRLGRLDDARRHLEELLARAPGHDRGLTRLAQLELLDGDPGRAVELYRRRAKVSPRAADASDIGLALVLARRYAEAERELRQAAAQAPDDPQVALNLADCLLLLGRRGEAGRFYRRIADELRAPPSPPDWQLLSVRAQALAHLEDRRGAVETIQNALRLTPDNPELAFQASLVYTLAEDHTSALLYAEKALAQGVSPVWFRFPWFDPLRGQLTTRRLADRGR